MTQQNFQVPNEVREFMEKSIDQARGAFQTFARAAQNAVSAIEPTLPSGVKEFNAKAVSYSETNINAAFDLARQLAQARDGHEILRLQGEFIKAQGDVLQEQAKDFLTDLQKAISGKP